MSVNKVIIVGNLGGDPESVAGGDGARLSVATNERWTDSNGNKQERTEWHRVICWGKTAKNVLKFLTKGRQVYIEGSIQTDEWTDDNGQERKTKEIRAYNVQFLSGEGPGVERNRPPKTKPSPNNPQSNSGGSSGSWPDDSDGGGGWPDDSGGPTDSYNDDDIPF